MICICLLVWYNILVSERPNHHIVTKKQRRGAPAPFDASTIIRHQRAEPGSYNGVTLSRQLVLPQERPDLTIFMRSLDRIARETGKVRPKQAIDLCASVLSSSLVSRARRESEELTGFSSVELASILMNQQPDSANFSTTPAVSGVRFTGRADTARYLSLTLESPEIQNEASTARRSLKRLGGTALEDFVPLEGGNPDAHIVVAKLQPGTSREVAASLVQAASTIIWLPVELSKVGSYDNNGNRLAG